MKPKIKKKTVIIVTVLLLLVTLVVLIGTTNALPKAEEQKDVVTYVGNLKVDVQDTGTIGSIALNTTADRKIEIKNDGETNQYVRVMVLPVYTNNDGVQEELKLATLIQDLNIADWKDGGDGYFYYLKKLQPEKQTTALFSKIKVPATQSEGKLTLYVKAEAITSGGNQYRKAFWNAASVQTAEPLLTIDQTYDANKDKLN